ncbi:MAG: DNA gyrase subunit A [Cardiobacteriaceae bacterium]|nr:DNA gyrase subunit A [Cardiobacteriaceae bacterium]
MTEFAQEVLPINLVDEMRNSYLDYAMSVIIGRALPDARDGLKPVHRRVMFSMHKEGHYWNKKYVKSASIVGDVMGKYHPHGDIAIYETLVRMAQHFSLRYPLVDGQGNFGSVDGDPPAAQRYTEARMQKISESLLKDLEKDTVDFVPNYDGSHQEPAVLPARLPHLLLNGSSGIAVGMATNIPPHHLGELIDGCLHLLENPAADTDALMKFIPGPDFPTGAMINGIKGIREAYETGKGKIYIRSKTHIEGEEGEKQTIVVDELPYQVNKAHLLAKIGELVKEKKIDGITALRDESDKDGIRMVVEVRKGDSAQVILNQLFQMTQLEVSFGINMMALVGGVPRQLSLKRALEVFLSHRREVVTRRTIFELRKARDRAHILEGLTVALANIDEIIRIIRASKTPDIAKAALLEQEWEGGGVIALLERTGAEDSRPEKLAAEYGLHGQKYRLSPEQAQAILDLRLHRLTGLEQDKISDEFLKLLDEIAALLHILRDPERLIEVIREELVEVKNNFNDKRRTEIITSHIDLSSEDLIAEEERVITITQTGYIKSQALSDYEAQSRGGRGRNAMSLKDDDFVSDILVASSHDNLLCFSNKGKVYWLKVYEIPVAGRAAKGRPVVNLLPFEEGERLNTVLAIREFSEDKYLFFATKQGVVKKTPLSEFSVRRSLGKKAINFREDDELVNVALTDGESDIMLFSDAGKAIRFDEKLIRSMGRGAAGVRGIKLREGQSVISLCVVNPDAGEILTICENGNGKRTPLSDYTAKGRGGQGMISIVCDERNGRAVAAMQVKDDEQIMIVTDSGTLIRTRVNEIRSCGRNSRGVRLIKTAEDVKVIAAARIAETQEDVDAEGENPQVEVQTSDDVEN